MQTPVQIAFHDVEYSTSFELLVRKRLRKLETVFPRLRRCQVFIGQLRQSNGNMTSSFNVSLAVHVPGGELVFRRDHHEDAYRALEEAFAAAQLELEHRARSLRAGRPV